MLHSRLLRACTSELEVQIIMHVDHSQQDLFALALEG